VNKYFVTRYMSGNSETIFPFARHLNITVHSTENRETVIFVSYFELGIISLAEIIHAPVISISRSRSLCFTLMGS